MKKRTVQTDNSEFQIPHSAFQILPWIIPLGFILLWFEVSETGLIPTYLMPHPAEIGKTGYNYILGNPGDGAYTGRFLNDAGASLIRVASGFALAVILGLPLGISQGGYPWYIGSWVQPLTP